MIYYLVTEEHTYTVQGWIDHYPQWRGRLRILPYERLCGWLRPGAFVFSDLERLTPRLTRNARVTRENAQRAGCPVLNDPARSLNRYDLQKSLDNAFRVYRPDTDDRDDLGKIRFPVFLRSENDHAKLTDLIHSWRRLDRALVKHPGSLIVEFLDTCGADGIFRKYSVMKVGAHLMARHLYFKRRWTVKHVDLMDPRLAEEEMAYVRSHPHASEIETVFERARIDYGRVDYSLHEGRIQVWEINTNPTMRTADGSDPLRAPVLDASGDEINRALEALDATAPTRGPRVWCGAGLPLRGTRFLV